MFDKLEAVEERIATLTGKHRETLDRSNSLAKQIEQMQSQMGDRERLAEENRTLREKVAALEGEIISMNNREEEIRGRLQSLLDKFEALEQELQRDSGPAAN